MFSRRVSHVLLTVVAAAGVAALCEGVTARQSGDDYPPFPEVSKDFEQVVSTADGARSLYTIFVDRKKHRMLAELHPGFEQQRIFMATSIAGGGPMTGWQWNDLYCYWTRHDRQLVLMEPELTRQVSGGPREQELRAAADRTFTDRVVTSVPILTFGPNGGPVIDLGALLIGQSSLFTGFGGNASLAKIGQVQAFPQNIEVPVTIPMANGQLTTLHYSISVIPQTSYQPREADERVGYFLTVFRDLSKNEAGNNQFTRYINRWNLQKRDGQLELSPPVQPIIFYIEHTVPVRYRRYVREGILEWNEAFEKVGIIDAVEVRQQDKQTGAFMDVHPEDVRYNFFRWITSETPFAMGPSRVNPETGEILDANIIFDDSMLKHYTLQYQRMIAAFGLDGIDPEAARWAEARPMWDPIKRFQRPDPIRDRVMNDPDLTDAEKADVLGESQHPMRDGLLARVVQQQLACNFAQGKAMQMRSAHLAMRLMHDELIAGEPGQSKAMIDGVPEAFLGAILKEIVMHEVGHTLGLRHNFKASTWLTLDEYRSRTGEPNVGSVMDYNPIDIPIGEDAKRGDWVPPTIGPYDYWAIEYGYTLDESRRQELLKQVAQPELVFATDEDASGPDPYVNRFDLGAEPLDYARERMTFVHYMRGRLEDRAVEDGESWHLARQAYEQLLFEHRGALQLASRFVGGVEVFRDRKGDPDGRDPLVPVDADRQREALQFVIENAFKDAAFDLRPDLLRKLATDKHRHWGNFGGYDEAFSVHDSVAQVQSYALLYLMNPGTLSRVFDNELRSPAEEDALTLPELFDAITANVYAELRAAPGPNGGQGDNAAQYTDRQPMISSLRRNLQSELTDRLIDLAINPGWMPKPVRDLSRMHLRHLDGRLDALLDEAGNSNGGRIDTYTFAHLQDMRERVKKSLNAIKVTGSALYW